jgi:hypothetical protein
MKNYFPKTSFLISILSFCVFLFIFIFFYRAINNNQKESEAKELTWQTEALKRNEIMSLNNSIEIIKDERAKLETYFAKSSNIVPFLDTIEGLATKVSAKAEVTSVDVLKDHTGLMIGLKASGTFNGLYRFLTLLENSPYELEFISVEIHRETAGEVVTGKNAGLPKWNAIFKIKLLSFIE